MSSYNFNILSVGSYGIATETAQASISGTYGLTTANFPLFVRSEQSASGAITLVLNALDQVSDWRDYNQKWSISSLNWESVAVSNIVGTAAKELTINIAGTRIIQSSATMPLFLYNSGLGNIEESCSLFIYSEIFAENLMSSVTIGHGLAEASANLFLSGEDLSITSSINCVIPGVDEITSELRIYIHGTE